MFQSVVCHTLTDCCGIYGREEEEKEEERAVASARWHVPAIQKRDESTWQSLLMGSKVSFNALEEGKEEEEEEV